jgi:hypothetical protein
MVTCADLRLGPAGEGLAAQLAALRAASARLHEVIEAGDAQLAAAGAALLAAEAQIAALSDRIAELERRLGEDSPTSSKPPSSDSPYAKKPRDRSLRRRGARKPGKQPGARSSTLRQVADPDEIVVCAPAACGRCGTVSAGQAPGRVTGRAQYGPQAHAQAANLATSR